MRGEMALVFVALVVAFPLSGICDPTSSPARLKSAQRVDRVVIGARDARKFPAGVRERDFDKLAERDQLPVTITVFGDERCAAIQQVIAKAISSTSAVQSKNQFYGIIARIDLFDRQTLVGRFYVDDIAAIRFEGLVVPADPSWLARLWKEVVDHLPIGFAEPP